MTLECMNGKSINVDLGKFKAALVIHVMHENGVDRWQVSRRTNKPSEIKKMHEFVADVAGRTEDDRKSMMEKFGFVVVDAKVVEQ